MKPLKPEADRAPIIELDLLGTDSPRHHKSATAYLKVNPPEPGESVYISPTQLVFVHEGESKQFRPLHLVTRDKQPVKVGGIFVTKDDALIATLDRYAREYSGDVQRIQ
jgi:hypothetical protein